ncbi:TPA: winged helix-turn-helix transcriptional regulator [Candidatus Woesearchaeota archaeon]|nr:winged helix-turn-helix transcriptional regulator [Candidatus Woesearchaeota archaeon]
MQVMDDESCAARSLKDNERRILSLLVENQDYTFKEIAKLVGLNEVSVRRIHHRLRQENVFHTLNIPNFSLLGYRMLILQNITVTSPFLIQTKRMMGCFLDEWPNCVCCHETYDGKILVRSVWRDADDFKKAHGFFFQKHGTDWIAGEQIDMVPLDHCSEILRIKDIT